MEIKIEISEDEIKDYIINYLVKKEIDATKFSSSIRCIMRPALEEISREFRKELKEEIINRSVEKIVGQDSKQVFNKALVKLIGDKK